MEPAGPDRPIHDGPAPEGPVPDETATPPTVLAVLVRESGPPASPALGALAAQDYPDLRVLVVDAAGGPDPAAEVAVANPRAFVRRVAAGTGFAEAANECLAVAERATFVLVCRDDAVLDPSAVRLLVEEAYRSNAGIVGPKIVDADRPDVLLEVGRALDRYGSPQIGIEPGEIDQEQHDAVRDVFYVSDVTMLVRADLFRELGGFDPDASPGAADLDLCWRSLLAGARVLVAPDARVRRPATPSGPAPDPRRVARNRVRTLLVCSSTWTLIRVVPAALVVAFVATVLSIFLRRRGRGRAALGAWWWNLRHFGAMRQARRRAQARRRIHDGELRELQVGGSALARAFLADRLHTEDRIRSLGEAGRHAMSAATAGARQPVALAAAVLALVFVVGSRELFFGSVPAVGSLMPWPGVRDLLDAYGSGWRFTGLGSAAAAPPAFVAMAALAAPLFGATGLARTLVVLGAFPVGAFGVYRLARPMTGSGAPAVVGALAYVVTPVPRNAIAAGRLGALVLFALGPYLVFLAMRAAGLTADGAVRNAHLRALFALTLVTAITTAFFPPAPLFALAAGLAVLLATPLAGGVGLGARTTGAAAVGGAGALVLLLPWSLELATGDRALLGAVFRPDLSLADTLRFVTGPNGTGWTGWGLLAAATLSLALGSGERLAWASRAWAMALLGFALAWLPGRLGPDAGVLPPEAPLTLAALGIALAVGIGVGALLEELPRFRFGWRQPAVAIAAVGALLPILSFVADAGDGRWRAPDRDWVSALSWTRAEEAQGGFRILWVGNPSILPLDPALAGDNVGYVLTRDGPGDGVELWPAPEQDGDRAIGDAIELTLDRRTNRLGHLVAPMGVRYVALPDRQGPDAGARAAPPPGLASALDDQTDLLRLNAQEGIALYENSAWAATRASLDEEASEGLPVDSSDSLRAALRTDLGTSTPITGPVDDSDTVEQPGAVLWSEAYDDQWEANAGGEELDHVDAFGLTNGYRLPEAGSVSITFGGQAVRYGMLALQAGLWIVLVVVWRRLGRPERTRSGR